MLVDEQHKEKWEDFFRYFNSTWMEKYPFETWNISDQLESGMPADNRTNNALENFNRQLNKEFPPRILIFLTLFLPYERSAADTSGDYKRSELAVLGILQGRLNK